VSTDNVHRDINLSEHNRRQSRRQSCDCSFCVFSQANCPSKAIKKPLNEIQPLKQNPWEIQMCY